MHEETERERLQAEYSAMPDGQLLATTSDNTPIRRLRTTSARTMVAARDIGGGNIAQFFRGSMLVEI